jgi:ribosomal protein S1
VEEKDRGAKTPHASGSSADPPPGDTGASGSKTDSAGRRIEDDRVAKLASKRQLNIEKANVLLAKNTFVEGQVWKTNRAGVLLGAEGVTGFLPFKELTFEMKQMVRNAQDKAAIHFKESGERAREAGMSVLMGQKLSVRVISVDEATERVVFSMGETSHAVSAEVLEQASAMVGTTVTTTVTNITDFGVFCRFDVQGTEMVGLVYRTEISWMDEDGDAAMKTTSVGDSRSARVVHVDQSKAHVFLSFKRTETNPLLETLDSLLLTGDDSSGRSPSTGRETVESIDLRPLLGDLEEAKTIAASLTRAGFHSVSLGARLNSKATSQQVEVYLSKAGDANNEVTTMIVRKGDAVQEVRVRSQDRERIKKTVASVSFE